MTTATNPTKLNFDIGGTKNFYNWNWQDKQYQIVYETIGQGNPVLILPAFSTVSSRTEMKSIANILAAQYQVTVLDWLGFGDSECPPVDYNPILFQQLLQDLVKSIFNTPIILIAAGHASGYALKLVQDNQSLVSKLILIAPTWQGPLRVMGLPDGVRNGGKNLVRSPIIGQGLYYLNTTPSFLRLMYKRHVYVDETKLTPEFIAQKHQITSKQGARYAPAAFVTGAIDPVATREEFLSYLSSVSIPVFIILAENAPPKSKAEMEAMAALEPVQTVRLSGTLGIYEENSQAVTEAIQHFI
ncbi:MAG: alpha/beta hydrolase [Pleurocapsa minor HA4230-MV1]|jgi:pimeloyl-ACP methyl ester carboxylesterase|nr:alpha/beta hydrolase [Pleurocapsa minor HA4230-MV1]